MENEEITGNLARLDAQIEALLAAVGAIARSMPNNGEVLRRFDLRAQTLIGTHGANPTPEVYMAALHIALDSTRARLALAKPGPKREQAPGGH